MKREFEKIRCPGCGSMISAYVPHMGDGSGLRVVAHNSRDREGGHHGKCDASGRIVVRYAGEWVFEQ